MASNRRRSIKSLGKVVSNIDARLRYVQKRPAPRRIANRVVTTQNIVRNAVTTVEIAPDAVTPTELAPNAVTNDAIAPGAVTDTELADGAGGAKTYRQDSQPTAGYEGDLWFDTDDNNKLYIYAGTSWSSVRDLGIAAAQTAASAAQTTADGKNKVYRQTAEPTGGTYAEGDLWFDTDDNNKIYRRTGTSWTAVQLGGEALANINANKITAGSIDASVITVSNLDAGNLTAGTIAASRITSTSISAANITAAQITSGAISSARITSDSISAAEINADKITAGTISGRDINLLSGGNGLYLDNGGRVDARYGTSRTSINDPDAVWPVNARDTGTTAYSSVGAGGFVARDSNQSSFSLNNGRGYANIWYVGADIHGNTIDEYGAWFDSRYINGSGDITFQTTNNAGNRIISARANGDVSMAYLNSSTGTNIVRSGGILYLSSSTIKIKENIEYVEDSMLDVINLLKPVRYTLKRTELDTDFSYALKQLNKEIGFIVEDIEEVQQNFKASLLSYDAEDLSLIDLDGERDAMPYTIESDFEKNIVPIMYKDTSILAICVKAIQELTEKVKDLESRIN